MIGNLADIRRQTFEAYRTSLGQAGLHLPDSFRQIVGGVTAFADPLAANANDAAWQPAERRWNSARRGERITSSVAAGTE